MRTRIRRGATVVGALALTVALTTTMPVTEPASAAWQATSRAPAITLTTGALTPPTTTCTPVPGLLGLADSATISWAEVPRATGYRLHFGSGSTPYRDTAKLSFDITGTLIISLIGALLGSSTTVTVVAKVENWESPRSNGQVVVASGLAGVTCQNR